MDERHVPFGRIPQTGSLGTSEWNTYVRCLVSEFVAAVLSRRVTRCIPPLHQQQRRQSSQGAQDQLKIANERTTFIAHSLTKTSTVTCEGSDSARGVTGAMPFVPPCAEVRLPLVEHGEGNARDEWGPRPTEAEARSGARWLQHEAQSRKTVETLARKLAARVAEQAKIERQKGGVAEGTGMG